MVEFFCDVVTERRVMVSIELVESKSKVRFCEVKLLNLVPESSGSVHVCC